jgi:hypothetical protein
VSLAGVIARGQRAAEAQMTDSFTAYAPGTPTVVNGLKVLNPVSQGSTRGRIAATSQQGADTPTRTFTVGDVKRPVLEGGLHIPISAPVPRAGDRGVGWEYLCTAVGAGTDPSLVGRRYLVVGVPAKSHATARRLDVVEVPW